MNATAARLTSRTAPIAKKQSEYAITNASRRIEIDDALMAEAQKASGNATKKQTVVGAEGAAEVSTGPVARCGGARRGLGPAA